MNKNIAKIAEMMVSILLIGLLSSTAWAAENQGKPIAVDLEDGEYSVDVTLDGGTGRAEVVSPAVLIVDEGLAYARVEWSSSHYDYMKVGEEKYLPVNEEGNSIFEIPVTAFDAPMDVLADTTAMSVPHEIEYTLTFDEASIAAQGQQKNELISKLILGIAVAAVLLAAGIFWRNNKRKGASR